MIRYTCGQQRVKYTSPAQSVEHGDVGKHVEDVVGVRWVVGRGPLVRCG